MCQKPTVASIIVVKKTTAWGEPGFPATFLADHDVQTAEHLGWETLRNGDLIRNAVQDGYDLLIISDQSIRFQQNLFTSPASRSGGTADALSYATGRRPWR